MHKLKCVDLKTYRSSKKLQHQKRRSVSTEFVPKKKTLTQAEQELVKEKIQGSRGENINKSFVGKSNPIYATIAVIAAILLFFAFIAWVVIHSS